MDPITTNVNQNIDEYIDGLVAQCLQAPGIVNLPPDQKSEFTKDVEDYLTQVLLEALVNKLNSEQLSQIENLEPASPEMAEKVQQLAAQIPGFANELENKFHAAVTYIKQNSQIPAA